MAYRISIYWPNFVSGTLEVDRFLFGTRVDIISKGSGGGEIAI